MLDTRRQRKTRTYPMRLILVVPFVMQIFGTVSLVGYLSFRNGQRAINDLATQVAHQVSDRIIQHLDTYLSVPRQLNEINLQAYDLGLLDLEDFDRVGQYFWKQMRVYNIGYINYANQQGEFIGIERTDTGQLLINDRTNTIAQGQLRVYASDDQGRRDGLLETKPYDPREEDWYQVAVEAGHPVWSEVYQWEDKPEILSISSSFPVYDRDNQLIGVIGVDLILSQISDFLKQLNVSPRGQVFVIEPSGALIASSTAEQPYRMVDGMPQRLTAFELSDPLVQATAQTLKQRFPDFSRITSGQLLDFHLKNGDRTFAYVAPWRDSLGLNWLVVVVIPQADFMSQINKNTYNTILLCLLALASATGLGLLTARWVMHPIRQLNRASQAIASGALNQSVTASPIQELNQLASSFNDMAEQLRASFKALEESHDELEHRVEARTQELKNALDDLQRTQAQMIQSEKMSSLGQLVAGVAHEINNPISFIYGNFIHLQDYAQKLLDIAKRKYSSTSAALEDGRESHDANELAFIQQDLPKLLSSMGVGVDRIINIVASLRTFSRMDEADIKAVDIHGGIDSTLMILQHRLKAQPNRGAIAVVKDYGLLPLVECYAGQLNQVFMNILSNAIDALDEAFSTPPTTSAQGASLTKMGHSSALEPVITIRTTLTNAKWITIAIADNGAGMPAAVQSRIFDPFFTTKPIGKGTGLGMSISHQIVTEKHKGSLDCVSTAGQGTEFIIHLPISQTIRHVA